MLITAHQLYCILKYIISHLFIKLLNTQTNGAKGLLLYDDPKRAAPKNASNRIYPNGEFLPPEGTQRGFFFN